MPICTAQLLSAVSKHQKSETMHKFVDFTITELRKRCAQLLVCGFLSTHIIIR